MASTGNSGIYRYRQVIQHVRGSIVREGCVPSFPLRAAFTDRILYGMATNLKLRRICIDFRVRPGEIQEDQLTALLESYSARWPTSLFMGAAIASMIGSLVLKSQKKEQHALFIGQWAAPFLILGLYNKMVKQHGSDTHHHHHYHDGPDHGPEPKDRPEHEQHDSQHSH